MKRIGLLIGFLAVLAFLLPLTAQDAKKKDADKDAKKDVDKKDVEKKDDDKKDPDKKEEKKKVEKLVFGGKFISQIRGIKAESNREYLVEIQEIDPKKVQNVNAWSNRRQQELAQQLFNISRIDPKDVQGRFNAQAQYQKDVYNYKVELAKQNVFTPKNIEVRATETAKVRSMIPPIDFDDKGFQKKWTKKELEALREKSPLHLAGSDGRTISAPGFPTDFDAIKQGQRVEIYMAKVAPMKKDDVKKKKGPDDDDPPGAKAQPNEYVLIVILGDGK